MKTSDVTYLQFVIILIALIMQLLSVNVLVCDCLSWLYLNIMK